MRHYKTTDLPFGLEIVQQSENFAQISSPVPLTIQLAEELLKRGLGVISFSYEGSQGLIACRKEAE